MVFFSPAKINLHLAVGGIRQDGYHGICSWFLKVGLLDAIDIDIDIEPKGRGTVIEGNHGVPAEHDLMRESVRVFSQETGLPEECVIRITKNIPIGAGLGGGSSNAATVLKALNVLHNHPLPPQRLLRASAQIGSDVPFFLGGPSAIVTGRGEVVEEFKTARQWWALIVDPGFSVSTKEAYRWLDETAAAGKEGNIARQTGRFDGFNPEHVRSVASMDPRKWCFYNDFTPALYLHFPLLRDICDRLRNTGAFHAGISGSGSACFGLYQIYNDAKKACEKFQDMRFWLKETLACSAYDVLQ